jgi:hypothetical protein
VGGAAPAFKLPAFCRFEEVFLERLELKHPLQNDAREFPNYDCQYSGQHTESQLFQ